MKRSIIFKLLVFCLCLYLTSCECVGLYSKNSLDTNNGDQSRVDADTSKNEACTHLDKHIVSDAVGDIYQDTTVINNNNNEDSDEYIAVGSDMISNKTDDSHAQPETNNDNSIANDDTSKNIGYASIDVGKFIYSEHTMMEGVNSNDASYAFKSAEQLGLFSKVPTRLRRKIADLEGTYVYNFFGKDVTIKYVKSLECVDDIDDAAKKYSNVNRYLGDNSELYEFCAETNQLIAYYKPYPDSGCSIGEKEAIEICTEFVERQLGEGILDSYQMFQLYDGKSYGYTFIKQIAGFDTTDTICVKITAMGEIKSYSIQHIGVYNEFVDKISYDDIVYTVDELSYELHRIGVSTRGYRGTKLVLGSEGVLFVAVSYNNGSTYYAEILKAQ